LFLRNRLTWNRGRKKKKKQPLAQTFSVEKDEKEKKRLRAHSLPARRLVGLLQEEGKKEKARFVTYR